MRVESVARSSTCAPNVSDVANRCVFSMSRGSWCSKSSFAKAAGAEVAVERTGEKWHAAVARSTFARQNVENTSAPETFWKFRCSKMPRGCGEKHICKSKCTKTPHSRSHFGSSDVPKCHAAVAKSTFASQNAQNTTFPEPFWKFRCSKMPRGCGEKHICKSKCTKLHIPGAILEVATFQNATRLWRKAHLQVKMHKTPHSRSHFGSCDVQKLHAAVARSIFCKSKCGKHHTLGPLLVVPMFQNATRLWREAHLQVKMHKTPHSRSHFGSSDVQKCHAAVARSTFASQNAQNTTLAEPFWKFRCSKMARGCGAKHICKSKCGKHHTLGPLFVVPMSKNGKVSNY